MINISKRAIAELKRIQKNQYPDCNHIRVGINQGGCLNYAYNIEFAQEINEADLTFNHDSGMVIVANSEIYSRLQNLTIDYLEDLMGGAFQFKNPNIAHHCSCGLSFDLEL